MEGDCHLPVFCRSVSSVPAWSAAARTFRPTCPADLSGRPVRRRSRRPGPAGQGRPTGGPAGLRAAHLEEISPGAGGLEGDVLPPEISRFGAAERPVPEHSADRHVDAPSPVGRLGGPLRRRGGGRRRSRPGPWETSGRRSSVYIAPAGPDRSRGPGAGRRCGDWPWFSPPAVTLPHGVVPGKRSSLASWFSRENRGR